MHSCPAPVPRHKSPPCSHTLLFYYLLPPSCAGATPQCATKPAAGCQADSLGDGGYVLTGSFSVVAKSALRQRKPSSRGGYDALRQIFRAPPRRPRAPLPRT